VIASALVVAMLFVVFQYGVLAVNHYCLAILLGNRGDMCLLNAFSG
jgi:hypothetical protein